MNSRLQNATIVVLYAIAIIVPIALLAIIHRYAVNAFILDDWEVLPLIAKLHAHSLSFGDLWAQHNEHRMLFPYLMFMLTYKCYAWNDVTINYETFLLTIPSLVILGGTVRRAFANSTTRALLTAIFSVMLFSMAQWFIWFTGFDLQWETLLIGTVGCVYCLTGPVRTMPLLVAAVLFATLGTYSLANGLALWWVVLLVMLLDTNWWNSQYILVWSAFGVAAHIMFFIGWRPLYQADPTYWIHHPIIFILYSLAFLSNTFAVRFIVLDILVGGLGCLLLAADLVAYSKLKKQTGLSIWPNGAAWLILTLTALVSAVICAKSRCPLGVSQALSSRYITFGNVFWIGLIGFTLWIYSESMSRGFTLNMFRYPKLAWAASTVLTLLFLVGEGRGFLSTQDRTASAATDFIAECNVQHAPGSLIASIYPNATILTNRLAIASSLRQGPFCNPADVKASSDYLTASTLISKDDPSDAIPLLETAAHHLQNFAIVHYKLGYCYFQMGRNRDARGELRKARGLDYHFYRVNYVTDLPSPPI